MSYLTHILPWADRPAPVRTSAGGHLMAKKLWSMLAGMWQRVLDTKGVRGEERRLRVVERIALGDKQFVAVLELDGTTFLASGGQGVPLSLTPANQAGKKATRVSSMSKATQATGEKPKRVRAKSANSAQSPALDQAAPKRATTRIHASIPLENSEKWADPINTAGGTGAVAVARSKRERNTPAAEPKLCERCAALITGDSAMAEPVVLPVEVLPAPSPLIVKAPKRITKARPQAPSSEHETPALNAGAPSKETPVASLDEAASEPAASASTAFAALLELRMLATEVFDELDANPEFDKTDALQSSALARPERAEKPAVAAQERNIPSRILSRLHRVRGRLSAYACFLVLFLLPHGIARGQSPPGFSVVAGHTASIARGSPFELGVAGLNFLAEAPLPNGDIHITGLGGSSASWSIVVLLTLLTLIPALLLCITPFARLLIVFHFLRQALGLQTTPSNQTLIGLSLILTFFLMQPTGEVIYRDAIVPAQAGKLTPLDAVMRAGDPMRHFMAHYVREKDAELFLEIAKEPRPRTVEDMSFRVLLPSYILSELKAGFQIGTVLFLPFLIVDMVVASITTSVGMMQLPPVVISTPLKLLLFLMVDGWHLLIGALMRSFN